MSSGDPHRFAGSEPVLLADAGNTALKLALVAGGRRWTSRVDNSELARLADWRPPPEAPPPRRLVSASVRPSSDGALDALSRALGAVHEPVRREALGLAIRCRAPARVGIDRLLAARALRDRAPVGWICVGCGTAITCDAVGADGAFEGGLIAPGAGSSARALARCTSLPEVALAERACALGLDTEDALAGGIYWGFRGLVAELVRRLVRDVGGRREVAFTGGDGAVLVAAVPGAAYFPDLVLDGLASYARAAHGVAP